MQFRLISFKSKTNILVTLSKIAEIAACKIKAARSEFMTLLINSLSHELVTPLTEIIQLTDESMVAKSTKSKDLIS